MSFAATADTGERLPEPEQSELELRAIQHQQVLRLIDEQRFTQALGPAAEVVDSTRQIFGTDSPELIVPLLNLASIQRRTSNYESARENFSECVRLIDKHYGILDERLIRPLAGLADIYNLVGRHDLAALAYERALSVSHANKGFYNLDQVTLRDGLALSYQSLGDIDKANFHMKAQVYVHEYRFGEDSPKVIPSIYKVGAWYGKTGQPAEQLMAYRAAYKLGKTAEGDNDPDLIGTLRFVAQSYLEQPTASGANLKNLAERDINTNLVDKTDDQVSALEVRDGASSALKRAIKINEAQPEPDMLLQAELLTELADVYTLFSEARTANKYYRRAWDLFAEQPDAVRLLEDYFGSPRRIGELDIPRVYPDNAETRQRLAENPEDFGNGYISVRFNVTSTGGVKKLRVIEEYPAGVLTRKVKSGIRYARFRPVRVDRESVAVDGQTYRYEFRFDAGIRSEDNAGDDDFEPLPNPNKAAAPEEDLDLEAEELETFE